MISFTNKVLKVQNKWLKPNHNDILYHVYTSGTNGSVTATPDYGPTGTIVTLSNTPDTGYEFDHYNISSSKPVSLNNNQLTINDADVYVNGVFAEYDPYNPLGLPANTIRVKFKSGYTPDMGDTQTFVDSTNNVWDIYKESNDWYNLFTYNFDLLEVLGANTSNVTSMSGMFGYCAALTSVQLFNTSSVTNMSSMFVECTALITLPLFDTSNVTNMDNTFMYCNGVQGGALALYQQASTQTTPPTNHAYTFMNCGTWTTTGAAELAQIPSSWGGTGA